MTERLNIVVLGYSITSSWGNGHATTYRALLGAMADRGHDITFLERDVPWLAQHRDLLQPAFCDVHLYNSLDDLADRFCDIIANADVVIVGSCVADGVAMGILATSLARGVCAFYDLDTPVTLANLERGRCEYLSLELIRRYNLYLSFSGGPILVRLERVFGSPMARALHCCVDAQGYSPPDFSPSSKPRWDLGYLGNYCPDRQPPLDKLLLEPARRLVGGRFVVAGPEYPPEVHWPSNVQRIEYVPPSEHRAFYNIQRFTLNVTRADMRVEGHSPSVRLFEAAACGTPIISDAWPGLDELFAIGSEVLIADSTNDVLEIIRVTPEHDRLAIAAAARKRVLAEHTAERRAQQLEQYLHSVHGRMRETVRR